MKTRRIYQWLTLLAAVVTLILIIGFVRYRMDVQAHLPAPVKTVVEQHPDVGVITCESGPYAAHIIAYGTAKPHFDLTLTAQVTGQINRLSAHFETGRRVKKGDLLVQLEDSDYQAAVAAARKDVSDAQLSLLEEQRSAEQARNEWQASEMTGTPDSELVLHKPQLAAAETAIAKAEAALASALKDLQQTRISAPFDALIVERNVAPGSYVQAGGEIATLYSTDRVEIAVSLSAVDWTKLPEPEALASGSWEVQLSNVETGGSWTGHVLRSAQHLDSTTRKRTLIISVDRPLDQPSELLPGTFVKATIPGRQLDQLWKLPSSTLSQKGEIWFVTADNTLDAFSASPVFSDSDAIYIAVPDALATSPQRILLHPLSSYLRGMVVNPVAEQTNEQ